MLALAKIMSKSSRLYRLVSARKVSPPYRTSERRGHTREEQINRRKDNDGVDGSKKGICTPADVGEHGTSSHDDHKVEDPVGGSRQRVGRGAHSKRSDFCRIKPGHTKVTDREPSVEEEKHKDREDLGGLVRVFLIGGEVIKTCEDSHSDSLEPGHPEHKMATTSAFDDRNGDKRSEEVTSTVDTRDDSRHNRVEAETGQHRSKIIGNKATFRSASKIFSNLGAQLT